MVTFKERQAAWRRDSSGLTLLQDDQRPQYAAQPKMRKPVVPAMRTPAPAEFARARTVKKPPFSPGLTLLKDR